MPERFAIPDEQCAVLAPVISAATPRGARGRDGDRAYDSDAVIVHIEALGLRAIIPSRSHRKVARTLDRDAYRQRNIIERWFGRLKGFRRIATRYDKTLLSYAAFVATAAFLVVASGWRP